MFHNIKKAAALSLAAFAAFGVQAQDNQSGYFVEDYTYRFLMNPAMDNSKNFVAIPAIGNLGFGLHGNLGVSDVIYNVNGRTDTFLNPNVSANAVKISYKTNKNIALPLNIKKTTFKTATL